MQAFPVSPGDRVYLPDMITGRPAKTTRTEFGERVAAARQQLGLTQAQVAEELGITQQSYAGWERRHTALKPGHLRELARILKVSVDFLLGEKPSRQRGNGPAGKARRVFEAVSKLPRHQQQRIVSVVEALVAQAGAA